MGISLVNMEADIMIAASSYAMLYHAILCCTSKNRVPCLDMNERQRLGNVTEYVNDLHFMAFFLRELHNTTF